MHDDQVHNENNTLMFYSSVIQILLNLSDNIGLSVVIVGKFSYNGHPSHFPSISFQSRIVLVSLREKCPNTEFFLVRIFLYSGWIQENKDQKKLRLWTLFMQFVCIGTVVGSYEQQIIFHRATIEIHWGTKRKRNSEKLKETIFSQDWDNLFKILLLWAIFNLFFSPRTSKLVFLENFSQSVYDVVKL